MGTRLRVAAAVLSIGVVSGCSSTSSDPAAGEPGRSVAVGDPAYALSVLHDQPFGDVFVSPSSLAEALPNHRVQETRSGSVASFSDALAVGRVTGAAEGAGVIWRGEHDFTVVGFDDERASTRTVVITMIADQMTGTPRPPDGELDFRVLVPQGADPDRFARSLAGLGRIAVVLSRDPSPTESTVWRPIIDDRLIAVIAEDGSLQVPTMRHSVAFAGDIQTESDLLAAAHEPPTTTTVTAP